MPEIKPWMRAAVAELFGSDDTESINPWCAVAKRVQHVARECIAQHYEAAIASKQADDAGAQSMRDRQQKTQAEEMDFERAKEAARQQHAAASKPWGDPISDPAVHKAVIAGVTLGVERHVGPLVKELEAKIVALEKQVVAANERRYGMTGERDELKAKLAIRNEIAARGDRIAELERQLAALHVAYDALQSRYERLDPSAEATRDELKAKLATAQAEAAAMRAVIRPLKGCKCEKCRSVAGDAGRDLLDELEGARISLRLHGAAAMEMLRRIGVAETELAKLRTELVEAVAMKEGYIGENERLQKENESLRSRLKSVTTPVPNMDEFLRLREQCRTLDELYIKEQQRNNPSQRVGGH